jgi:hypothetical protein
MTPSVSILLSEFHTQITESPVNTEIRGGRELSEYYKKNHQNTLFTILHHHNKLLMNFSSDL